MEGWLWFWNILSMFPKLTTVVVRDVPYIMKHINLLFWVSGYTETRNEAQAGDSNYATGLILWMERQLWGCRQRYNLNWRSFWWFSCRFLWLSGKYIKTCFHIIFTQFCRSDFLHPCPSLCLCAWSGGKMKADCSNRGLNLVPSGFRTNVQVGFS